MSLKPVLVKLEADLWADVKERSSVLGLSPSEFTERALSAALGRDVPELADAATRLASAVQSMAVTAASNYVSSTALVAPPTVEPTTTRRAMMLRKKR